MENIQELQLETTGKFLSAKVLGIQEKERCALIRTLAFIEAGRTLHVQDPLHEKKSSDPECAYRFNMAFWRGSYRCGTVACLGGTAELLSSAPINFNGTSHLELRKLFGFGEFHWDRLRNKTEKGAAIVLRGYLETGKADWSQVA